MWVNRIIALTYDVLIFMIARQLLNVYKCLHFHKRFFACIFFSNLLCDFVKKLVLILVYGKTPPLTPLVTTDAYTIATADATAAIAFNGSAKQFNMTHELQNLETNNKNRNGTKKYLIETIIKRLLENVVQKTKQSRQKRK